VAEGLVQLEKAIAADPKHFEARANRAFLAMELPEENEIICLYFRDALAIDSSWWDGWYNLGNLLSEQGSSTESEAIACYQQAVSLRPKYASAHNNLGILLQVAGNLELATKHCEEAAGLKPSNAQYLHNLASCLHQAGKHQQAMQLAQEAVRLSPAYHEALAQLATIYKESNQSKDLAPKLLKRAMECPGVNEVQLEDYSARRSFLLLMLQDWSNAHACFRQMIDRKRQSMDHKRGTDLPAASWQAALDCALYQELSPSLQGHDGHGSSSATEAAASACTRLSVLGEASLNSMVSGLSK
jgi:tetratricopeptide (TPR) repeat protein